MAIGKIVKCQRFSAFILSNENILLIGNCTNFMINLSPKKSLLKIVLFSVSQPYRTTPLILPGAKINHQRNLPIESYLRHHPNPQISGPPTHDYTDTLMKQKVADSVLQRYGGEESSHANGSKVGIRFVFWKIHIHFIVINSFNLNIQNKHTTFMLESILLIIN